MKRLVAKCVWFSSVLVACASGAEKSESSAESSDDSEEEAEEVTLRIATYLASPDEQAALQAVIDAYGVKHPNVSVELRPLLLSPPQTIAQLTGDMPIEGGWDMAIHTFTSVPGVVGVTLDLNTLPELERLKSRYHPAVAEGMESAGIWAGMPLGIAGFNIAISNQAALDQLGVARPPGSLDELLAVCERYVELGGGAELPKPIGEASDEFGPLVVMAAFLPGDATFGDTASEVEVVDEWRTAVGALKTFADNDCVFLVDDTNGNGSHHDENFDRTITGKNALGVGPIWGLGYFIAQGQVERGNFDFGPLIGGDAGFIYTVELVTANIDTPHVQEVSDFMAVVGDPEVQIDYLRARGGTPAARFGDPGDIGDAALETAYTEFQAADKDGRAGSFPPFLLDLPKAVGPLRSLITGMGSRDEVVEAYLCTMTRHPAFQHYESDDACIEAIRAMPDAD